MARFATTLIIVVLASARTAVAGTDPCVTARRAISYDQEVSSHAHLKGQIDLYRAKWQRLCDGDATDTLSSLFSEIGEIVGKFWELQRAIEEQAYVLGTRPGAKPDTKRLDDFRPWLTGAYPATIPGFLAGYEETAEGEVADIRPDIGAWRSTLAQGSDEDRDFFKHFPFELDENSWSHISHYYIVCTRYDEFDWAGNFARLEDLRKRLTSDVYLRHVDGLESSMLEGLTQGPGGRLSAFCTCGEAAKVLPTLVRAREFLQSNRRQSEYTDKLTSLIGMIETGQTRVVSDRKQYCGGG
jgi:hypothetical protein